MKLQLLPDTRNCSPPKPRKSASRRRYLLRRAERIFVDGISAKSVFRLSAFNPPMLSRPIRLLLTPIFFGVYTLEFGTLGLLPTVSGRLNLSTSIDGFSMALFALFIAIAGPILGLLGANIHHKKLIAAAAFALAGLNIASAFSLDPSSLMTARFLVLLIHPMLFPMLIGVSLSWHSGCAKSLIIALGILGTVLGLALSVPMTIYVANNVSYSSCLITFAILDFLIGLKLMTSRRLKRVEFI